MSSFILTAGSMDATEPPQESEPLQAQQQQQRRGWSFRRFGADKQADCSADTWDALRSQAEPLLRGLGDRTRDLLHTQHQSHAAMEAARPARVTDCRSATRDSDSAARRLLQTLDDMGAGRQTMDNGSGWAADRVVRLEMTSAELSDLRRQLRAWLDASRRLMGCCQASIAASEGAREVLGSYDRKVRDFILTVWSLNAERVKAFPPFFSDLAPLDPSLFGMGRVRPPAPTEVPPQPPAVPSNP